MGEHRIIKPSGPVKRITVDLDASGQVTVNGQGRGPLGNAVPLQMFEVCTILAGVLASSLLAIAGKLPLKGNLHASDEDKPGTTQTPA